MLFLFAISIRKLPRSGVGILSIGKIDINTDGRKRSSV